MSLKNKPELLFKQLELHLESLNNARKLMHYSKGRCQDIIKKPQHSDEELESCEALTARFARTADILTQKILTTIFLLLQETPKTFIDKCNLAEKLGIIASAGDLIKIRELRNEVAHEYCRNDLIELFSEILRYSNKLDKIIVGINAYTKELYKSYSR